jgi:hypothetical protein
LASVCPTSARTALPVICFGHIDKREEADVACARRPAAPPQSRAWPEVKGWLIDQHLQWANFSLQVVDTSS